MDEENKKLEEALTLSRSSADKNNIGILKEHTLHRVMKFYISSDLNNHEIPIGKRFADVMIDGVIYEVQTKSFNLLRDKLSAFLEDYDVWIVHPMAYSKHYYLNNEYGELIKEKNSPRHLYPLEIMKELYKIKSFLTNPYLHFKIIMMDMDEYRIETKVKTYHSKGYERDNQIPKRIIKTYDIKDVNDWYSLLDEYQFSPTFTAKSFSKATHILPKTGGIAVNVLTYLGVLKMVGKEGRSYVYEINKR